MLIIPVPMPDGVFVRSDCLHKCRHFVYRDGRWLAYASKWKAQFRGPACRAAVYAGGPTITDVQKGIAVIRERKRRRRLKIQHKRGIL